MAELELDANLEPLVKLNVCSPVASFMDRVTGTHFSFLALGNLWLCMQQVANSRNFGDTCVDQGG